MEEEKGCRIFLTNLMLNLCFRIYQHRWSVCIRICKIRCSLWLQNQHDQVLIIHQNQQNQVLIMRQNQQNQSDLHVSELEKIRCSLHIGIGQHYASEQARSGAHYLLESARSGARYGPEIGKIRVLTYVLENWQHQVLVMYRICKIMWQLCVRMGKIRRSLCVRICKLRCSYCFRICKISRSARLDAHYASEYVR